MRITDFFSIVFVLSVLLSACTSANSSRDGVSESAPSHPALAYGIPVDSFHIDTCCIKSGETLGGILTRAGATTKQIAAVTSLPSKAFNVRSIREGRPYLVFYQTDTIGKRQLCYFVYLPTIREADVFHLTDSVYVEHIEKNITTVPRQAEVVIESSLWNAMTGNRLPVELALELSEIYAWTIDFFGLQKGDSIRVLYDEQYVDSTRIGIGRIYASHFYHGKRWQQAYWFDSDSLTEHPSSSVIKGYFDREGNSLRKAFLKAPLNYKRISSHFSYARKHPIYKTVRPHTGVDYAAPAGTPVVAIGDGTVIFKAYKGGGGNTVKIRHNSTYTTAYLHLQGYAKNLKVGQHVQQGQVIGYVGSTGSSTGPHLDFRIWKNDTPIDPLKMVSPPSEPIPATYRPYFDSIVESYLSRNF